MPDQLALWDTEDSTGAVIKGNYRYTLWRVWNPELPRVVFIMLNPSTANQTDSDPTLRRCLGFAKSWGMGSLQVVNLYARISPHPMVLQQIEDPVGPENTGYIQQALMHASLIVCAWGCKYIGQRDREVMSLLEGREVHCFGCTNQGYPRHPLYIARGTPLVLYTS